MASKSIHAPRRDPYVYVFGALSLFGLFDALLLTVEHYSSLTLPCTFTGGCETVLTSRYATIFGLPISLLGVVFYGLMFFLVVHALTNHEPLPKKFLLAWGTVGFLSSVVLVGLQAFVVRAWCQYCLLSALTSTLIFVTAIVYFLARRDTTNSEAAINEEA